MSKVATKMSIREQEEKLLDKWREKRRGTSGFIRDGIVCEEEYLKSKLKIVIVLKEPNAEEGGEWKLKDSMMGEENWRIWNNVARWVYGIRNREQIPDWEYDDKESELPTYNWKCDDNLANFRKNSLKSICAMNLKKVPGGGTADYEVLSVAASNNRPFIKEQYNIYNPDLTICCGADSGSTGDMFRDAMGYTDTEETEGWKQTKRGIWWYQREKRKYVVIFNHPSARTKDSLLFYSLVDAVNEIYADQK